MKKALLFVTILFITINSFAQSKSFDQNLTQLMYAKNGMGPIENLTPKLVQGISEEHKAAFITKMNTLKIEAIKNIKDQFKKDYTNSQIIAIYSEFTSDKINYTEETIGFFGKFRKLKGQFSKSAKELYFQYQK